MVAAPLQNADRELAQRLEAWFAQHARDLPWRTNPAGRRDPYMVLVAEAMLLQTQVSRVVECLPKFLERFPTVEHLADAEPDEVLAQWRGMGYYRRARLLHQAAKMIVEDFSGRVPSSIADLRRLPGVGPYSAGAIASTAFGKSEPIVDGNVARVLLRLHARSGSADDRQAQRWLWSRAAELVSASNNPGVFNEALMELGATTCLPSPASPRCAACPWNSACAAQDQNLVDEIPAPKKPSARRDLFCTSLIVQRSDRAVLLEQRPAKGMWAGMWQVITDERSDRSVPLQKLAEELGLDARRVQVLDSFEHQTTHRRVIFNVGLVRVGAKTSVKRGLWFTPDRLGGLAISNAQLRVLNTFEHKK